MSKRALNDDERAELVAYLDGESTGAAKRAIEKKLSLDPVWRAEAKTLRNTWDLLDFLPRTEPSPSFTEKTLSKLTPIVKPNDDNEVEQPLNWASFRLVGLIGGWVAAVLLVGFCTYWLARGLMARGPGEAELTRDLRIIESKRLYDGVDDLEFLRQLDQPDLFGDDGTGG